MILNGNTDFLLSAAVISLTEYWQAISESWEDMIPVIEGWTIKTKYS